MSPDLIARIRELRYVDGLSCPAVGEMLGLSPHVVQKAAPGYPGKIDNAKLREAFERSGVSATWVAREIGWLALQGKWNPDRTKRWQWYSGDGSRVRRTLGLTDGTTIKQGRTFRYRQTRIDAESAARIAEVIGVAPWAVGCND